MGQIIRIGRYTCMCASIALALGLDKFAYMQLMCCLLFGLVRTRLSNIMPTPRPIFSYLLLFKFVRVGHLDTVNEIWLTLKKIHEGSSHVKTKLYEMPWHMRTLFSWIESLSILYFLTSTPS